MTTRLHIILLFFSTLLLTFSSKASRIEKGFSALNEYDYFKAKKIFYGVAKKHHHPLAYYGLAVIYSRGDNPFTNIDSAGKYIGRAIQTYNGKFITEQIAGLKINHSLLQQHADSIGIVKLRDVKKSASIAAHDEFLQRFYFCNKKLIEQAVISRDELELNEVIRANNSEITNEFLRTHPQSKLYSETIILRDRQVYNELTGSRSASSYIKFIESNPSNAMVNTAYEKLFGIYSRNKDIRGLATFVKKYPNAPQHADAWKLLFSLSVRSYSYTELKAFLANYPEFPLKNSILKELELNKLIMYPYRKGDLWGFVDNKGKLSIKPVYDAVTEFSDGLAVVNKNDSVYFINKENVNPFGKIFSEAYVYKNGTAPVKQNGKWCFINRLGQVVSKYYEEVNELSNSVYVVRSGGKYGTVDHFAQQVIEPKFDKLGDFINGFAYYSENGRYGFVSADGVTHKPEYEWISDFSGERVAIVKQNGKFGLINAEGNVILECMYDQIVKTGTDFMVVSNNLYGFYSSGGCFITQVSYDFDKEQKVESYTNGKYFRLIKKGVAVIDSNGANIVSAGTFEDVGLPFAGLMRVRKKNKSGFIDLKLNTVIGLKYAYAEDFRDSVALVKSKEFNVLINPSGKEVFSSLSEIERITSSYLLVHDEIKSIINHRGEVLFTEVEGIQPYPEGMIITFLNGEIKLISGQTLLNL